MCTHADVIASIKQCLAYISRDIEHLQPAIAIHILDELRTIEEDVGCHRYWYEIEAGKTSPCQPPYGDTPEL
jgi:hypothetical protein